MNNRRVRFLCASALAFAPLLAQAESPTVLHLFDGPPDASFVEHGLVMDPQGALYGSSRSGSPSNDGSVFQLTPPNSSDGAWKSHILLDFSSANLPSGTLSGVAIDNDGSLIATNVADGQGAAGGVVRLLPPAKPEKAWKLKALIDFGMNGDDNAFPEGVPNRFNRSQSRFGTTIAGGNFGLGSVYQIEPSSLKGALWISKTVHSFTSAEGSPVGELTADALGNLYGVTVGDSVSNRGTVFQLTKPAAADGEWKFTVLHVFSGTGDGGLPVGSLTFGNAGELLGVAEIGGGHGAGTIFKLAPPIKGGTTWHFAVVHDFDGAQGGKDPKSGLVSDGRGAFLGTTTLGGIQGCGTVYRIRFDTPEFDTLSAFPGGSGGGFPMGTIVLSNGTLFGATVGSSGFVSTPDCASPASVAFAVPVN